MHFDFTSIGASDLHLDTLLFNGHTTTADSLWGGVPVMTTPGVCSVLQVEEILVVYSNGVVGSACKSCCVQLCTSSGSQDDCTHIEGVR